MELQKHTEIINLSHNWEPDPEYDGFFPKGARSKSIFHSSDENLYDFLIPSYRYLFKESIERHPAQYWSEIVAYRISQFLNVNVPPAFVATYKNNETGKVISGALIEWFYNTENPSFLEYKEAGDFLSLMRPDFDRKKGKDHNFQDDIWFLHALSNHDKFIMSKQWIADFLSMFLFDIVIGNTDRHQDNWGIIFEKTDKEKAKIHLSPAYDNGTSLGYEILDSKIPQFMTDTQQRLAYINRGKHHIKNIYGGIRYSHFDFLENLLVALPAKKTFFKNFFEVDFEAIKSDISSLVTFSPPIPLTSERVDFMLLLIKERLEIARTIIAKY